MNTPSTRQQPRSARLALMLAALCSTPLAQATLQSASAAAAQGGQSDIGGMSGQSVIGAGGATQAILGMLAVLALIFACAWLARRLGLQRLGSSDLLKVVASTRVGQRERVVVVEIADSWLVLGVTPTQINALHTLAAQPAAPHTYAHVHAHEQGSEAAAHSSPMSDPMSDPMSSPLSASQRAASFASKLHQSLTRGGRSASR